MDIQEPTMHAELHQKKTMFEKWMNPSGKYPGQTSWWQHQGHIQQSALQFASVLSSEPKASTDHRQQFMNTEPDRDCPETDCMQNQENLPWKSQHTENNAVSKESVPQTIIATSNRQEKHFIPHLYLEKSARFRPKQAIKHNLPTTPIKPNLVSFKKQRIFMQDNALELSLNMPNMHKKPEYAQTIHYLKTWITQQGTRIKKFIMNGVIQ